jgi:hypothetical protein
MNPFTDDAPDAPLELAGRGSYDGDLPSERPVLIVLPTEKIFVVFLALKVPPFAIYMFGWLLIGSTALRWFLTLLLAAADFWFTKNVAGRLILGMRWSSRVTDAAATQWVFEYVDGGFQVTPAEHKIFWTALAWSIGAWIAFALFAIVRLSLGWCVVHVIGAALAGANAAGYWFCEMMIAGAARQEAPQVPARTLRPFVKPQAESVLLGTEEQRPAGLESASGQ